MWILMKITFHVSIILSYFHLFCKEFMFILFVTRFPYEMMSVSFNSNMTSATSLVEQELHRHALVFCVIFYLSSPLSLGYCIVWHFSTTTSGCPFDILKLFFKSSWCHNLSLWFNYIFFFTVCLAPVLGGTYHYRYVTVLNEALIVIYLRPLHVMLWR